MSENAPASRQETEPPAAAQESGTGFRADVPLAILESVRQHDRPTEVLEDEDLTASLPRRLGLTGVVESQIHRYAIARKRRERVSVEDVASLLRLVLRRPDAEAILTEAGRRLAREQRGGGPRFGGRLARFLPGRLASRMVARRVRRVLQRISGGTPLRVTANPLRVEMDGAITARENLGLGCVFYSAAIEEAARQVSGRSPDVRHLACQGRGDPRCVWGVD